MELVAVGEAKARLDLVEDADVGVGDMGQRGLRESRVLMAKPAVVLGSCMTVDEEDDEMEEETLDRGMCDNSPTNPGAWMSCTRTRGLKVLISGGERVLSAGEVVTLVDDAGADAESLGRPLVHGRKLPVVGKRRSHGRG